LLLSGLAHVLTPNVDRDALWNVYTSLPPDTVQVVAIGTSKIHANMNPAIIWDEARITSYCLSGSSMDLQTSYYYLDEAYRSGQNPTVVIIEPLMVSNDNYALTPVQKRNIISLPVYTRIRAVTSILPAHEWTDWISRLLQYRNRLFTNDAMITQDDYRLNKFDERPEIIMGYRFSAKTKPMEQNRNPRAIDEEQYRVNYPMMKKLIELALSHDSEVIVIDMPDANRSVMSLYNARLSRDLIQDGISVRYYSADDYLDGIKLDFDTDFYDSQHLNYHGGEKLSRWLANELSAYDIPRASDMDITAYERALEKYQNLVDTSVD